jgi:hypothetical protein
MTKTKKKIEAELPAIAPRTADELFKLMNRNKQFLADYVVMCNRLDKEARESIIKIFGDFAEDERVDIRLLSPREVSNALSQYCRHNPVKCIYFNMHG